MASGKPIEIKINRLKVFSMLAVSIIFILAGTSLVWIEIVTPIGQNKRPLFGFVMGIPIILFFGFSAFYQVKKILDRKPGLLVNDEGIFDNSGGISIGFIPWVDIVKIQKLSIGKQTFINVEVKNPLSYIDRQENILKRCWMKIHYKLYGSVIGITTNRLKCSQNELLRLLRARFYKLKRAP
ncbi:STM3941 family protein [Pedobacter sp. FW305-3-2-15-E-R2A2]|uniref:STM3941 family protein n=1 Tax=Pedobacter sp. FW305-3-2-15-E-R2A2 TaxID=3140251 RepID=UPI00314058DB